MTTQIIRQLIVNKINDMDTDDLVILNNEYCQSANYSDDEIYENDEEFFTTYFECKPMEVARAVCYGDYKFTERYVRFNGYGNLESIGYLTSADIVDNVHTIADYIIENESDFSQFDLEDLKDDLGNES